jgi:hypothetical protein
MTDDIICLRCGRCCYFFADGKMRKCIHLIRTKNGKTFCRVYGSRLGTVIYTDSNGRKYGCILRKDSPLDYPGCPYNKNDK